MAMDSRLSRYEPCHQPSDVTKCGPVNPRHLERGARGAGKSPRGQATSHKGQVTSHRSKAKCRKRIVGFTRRFCHELVRDVSSSVAPRLIRNVGLIRSKAMP